MKRKPTDYLRHIYYDNITYDLGALRYLVSVVGADHVMFGTDWPHWVHDTKGAFANTAELRAGRLRRHPRRERDARVRALTRGRMFLHDHNRQETPP